MARRDNEGYYIPSYAQAFGSSDYPTGYDPMHGQTRAGLYPRLSVGRGGVVGGGGHRGPDTRQPPQSREPDPNFEQPPMSFVTAYSPVSNSFRSSYNSYADGAATKALIYSEGPLGAPEKGKRKSAIFRNVVIVVLVLLIVAILGILVYVGYRLATDENSKKTEIKELTATVVYDGRFRLKNETFTDDLDDPNSARYNELETQACHRLDSIFQTYTIKQPMDSCKVTSFSPGSVVVEFRIAFRVTLSTGSQGTDAELQTYISRNFTTDVQAALIQASWNDATVDGVYLTHTSVHIFTGGNPCKGNNMCLNGGQCVPAARGSSYSCVCTDGFTGPRCEDEKDQPGQDNGTTVEVEPHPTTSPAPTNNTNTTCDCSEGYSCSQGACVCAVEFNGTCGANITVDTALKGALTSPAHPCAYPVNATCTWFLSANGTDYLVELRFHTFQLYTNRSTKAGTCLDDFVQINGKRYCGDELPPMLRSKEIEMTFHSDSEGQGPGFQATYYFINESAGWVYSECGGDLIATNEPQVFISPGYPDGYDNNMNCTWVIRGDNLVQITVLDLEMEKSRGEKCSFDSLAFFTDEKSNSSELTLCGDAQDSVISATSSYVRLHFVSDNYAVGAGFQIEYRETSVQTLGCGFPSLINLTKESNFELLSPGFELGDYGDHRDCEVPVRAPQNTQILVTVNEISLEPTLNCIFDSIAFFDGDTNATKLATLCGVEGEATQVQTTGSTMTLRMVTDMNTSEGKFNITISAVAKTGNCLSNPCVHGTCVESDFAFTCDCTDTEYIGDRCEEKNYCLKVTCPSTMECLPYPQNDTYKCVCKENTANSDLLGVTDCEIKATCGGDLVIGPGAQTHGSPGFKFASPGYSHGYGDDADCTWNIQVPDGFRVQLQFLDIEFAGDGVRCYSDRLDVYDDSRTTANHIGTICSPDFDVILSSSKNMMVVLTTNNDEETGRGFLASATAVEDPCQPSPCQNTQCVADRWNNTHLCVDNTKDPECGNFAVAPSLEATPRIVGGDAATPHSWPFIGSLQIRGVGHICGVVLIDRDSALTAAHCKPRVGFLALFGYHNLSHIEPNCTLRTTITEVWLHAGYETPSFLNNDFAFFRFSPPVDKWNKCVSPICLPEQGHAFQPGIDTYAVGWGNIFLGRVTPHVQPEELQQIRLSLFPRSNCSQLYNSVSETALFTEQMVCVSQGIDGTGACQGDSGGPLVTLLNGTWTLVGLTSWGYSCGRAVSPPIYTRVNQYISLIEQLQRLNLTTDFINSCEGVDCGAGFCSAVRDDVFLCICDNAPRRVNAVCPPPEGACGAETCSSGQTCVNGTTCVCSETLQESCDGNVTMETGANGTIASPHHPCPYPNNATCTWTFIVPNDSVVQLVFEEFELERAGRTKGCEKDFVQIGVRRYCGSVAPPVVRSDQQLQLDFRSDGAVAAAGFQASYLFLNQSEMSSRCNPNPCVNGGTCIVTLESHRCRCPVNYGGPTCATEGCGGPFISKNETGYLTRGSKPAPIRACAWVLQSPELSFIQVDVDIVDQLKSMRMRIESGGMSVELSGTTRGYSYRSPTNELTITYEELDKVPAMQLIIAYHTVYDLCSPNPCAHGKCSKSDGTYSCSCEDGYMGQTCSVKNPLCDNLSCQNGGSCVFVSDTVARCDCALGYTGTTCEEFACGQPHYKPSIQSTVTRIVGGRTAAPHSWPWAVAVTVEGATTSSLAGQWCGAALIANDLVLTAAHCHVSTNRKLVIGAHNLDKCSSPCRVVDIVRVWDHEHYDNVTTDNDIALVQFSPAVEFSDEISPICVAGKDDSLSPRAQCYAVGWGTGPDNPEELHQVMLPLLPQRDCMNTLGDSDFNAEHMICAGYLSGGRDTCQGDSGGPLVCLDASRTRWKMFGITSWGNGCADPNSPGAYTKLTEYTDWIQQNLPDG